MVEGDSGTSLLNFSITLSRAATSAVTVAYATTDGTASSGSDYDSRSGTLMFAAGETSKTVVITIHGDETIEGNESFALVLSYPLGLALGVATVTGTITNDDQQA